jgi:hypothetical protein
MSGKNIHKQISHETGQYSETRKPLFLKLEKHFAGRAVVSFFTSFKYPVQLDDDDCDMLQSVLQQVDTSKGLVLLISSPGGDGIAAERIVNVCRAYSGTGSYEVVVPGKAKSAATIVCMGASKIWMAPPSELGPVDPQILVFEDNEPRFYSAHNLVKGYDDLFANAVASTGKLEPYVQQLQHYDIREINQYRSLITLSIEMSKKILGAGMMAGITPSEIEGKIKIFLEPGAGTYVHGRPIYRQEATDCGLNVGKIDVSDVLWKTVYELYARTEMFVSSTACKAVESKSEAFFVPGK